MHTTPDTPSALCVLKTVTLALDKVMEPFSVRETLTEAGPRGDTPHVILAVIVPLESVGQRLSHNPTTAEDCESEVVWDTRASNSAKLDVAPSGRAYMLYGGRDVLGVGDCVEDCEGVPEGDDVTC